MRGRLISPKNLELKCWKLRVVLDSPQTVWVAFVIIYAINYCLGVVGLEKAMDFSEGCPRTAHCMDVRLLKTVPICLLDRKWSMCVVSKILLKMNGLECVWKEIVNA